MKTFFYLPCLLILLIGHIALAQNNTAFFKYVPETNQQTPDWALKMYAANPDVREVVQAYEQYYTQNPFEKNTHTQNYKHWLNRIRNYVDENGTIDVAGTEQREVLVLQKKQQQSFSGASPWAFIGPLETYNYADQGGFPVSWHANVYCIDQSVSNPNVLYAGTEGGGLHKTTDKGLNWTMVAADVAISTIVDVKVAPSDENVVYFTANDRIYKSSDGGVNWAEVYYVGARGYQLAIHPSNPNTVFCAAANGFYRSTNGGANWDRLYTDASWDVAWHPANSQVIYLLKTNSSLKKCEFYKSIDGGTSWSLKNNGWYSPSDPANASDGGARLAVTPASSNMIYVALLGNSKQGDGNWIGIYRSTDAGESWLNPNLPDGGPYNTATHPNLATFNPDGSGFNQGFYNFAITVSHNDPGKLWVGCLALSESADSGKSTVRIGGYYASSGADIGWIHPDVQDLHSLGNDVWVCTDGGINYSTDDLQTHVSRKNGLAASNFWGFGQGWNQDVMVGGRYHNGNMGYYQTYGVGNNLRLGGAESPTGYVNPLEERKVYFSDITDLFIPNSLGGSYTNDGNLAMYPNEAYFEARSSEIEYDPRYAHHLYLGKDNTLWKSTNEGGSFAALQSFGTSSSKVLEIEVARSNPQVIYCSVDNGTIHRSADGGQTWAVTSTVNTNGGVFEISLNPEDENDLWLASFYGANGQKVFRTTDGGTSWQDMTTATLDNEVIIDVQYQGGTNNIVYLATRNSIFYWDSQANDWVNYSSGLPVRTEAMEMKPFYRDSKMRMATYGKGIWEADLVQSSLPLAQPMTRTDTVYCMRDTVPFDCYSILNHSGSSWQWVFSPTPVYVSSATARNPKVVFGAEGSYDVTLTVTDGSGATSTKTINAMITLADRCAPDTLPGQAVQCVSSGDYMTTPDFNLTTETFSITAWVKPNGTQNDYTGIVMNNNDPAAGLNFRPNNELAYHWPGGAWWWSSGLIVPSGEWSYVALVANATSISVYLNGQEAIHSTDIDPVAIRTMIIGSYKGWGSRNYNGLIDEVCLWNRALSRDEIRDLRHLTKEDIIASSPGILAYYQFNESNGNALDRVGIAHARLNGNATRLLSTVPVGGGVSHRMDVNGAGIYNYGQTGLTMEFPTGATYPGGELVVSRINSPPDSLPNVYTHTGAYWIVNNYGANSSFTALSELRFDPPGGGPSAALSSDPNRAILYSRGANEERQNWAERCRAASVVTGSNGYLSYNTTCNLSSFSQFFISSNSASTPTIDLETSLTSSASICQGASLVLDAGPGFSNYLWSTGSTAQSITVSSSGNYSVEVRDSYGNTGNDTTAVVVHPLPVIAIDGAADFCPGDLINLSANTSASTCSWSVYNGSTTTMYNGASISFTAEDVPSYELQLTCSDAATNCSNTFLDTIRPATTADILLYVCGNFNSDTLLRAQDTIYTGATCQQTYTHIDPGANVQMRAGRRIYLTAGFKAFAGAYYKAQIGPFCTSPISQKKGFTSSIEEAFKVYPNPFNQEIRIEYTQEQAGQRRISIHDVLGKQVAVVSDYSHLEAGMHTINYDASVLKPGIYFIILESSGQLISKKLVKLDD